MLTPFYFELLPESLSMNMKIGSAEKWNGEMILIWV